MNRRRRADVDEHGDCASLDAPPGEGAASISRRPCDIRSIDTSVHAARTGLRLRPHGRSGKLLAICQSLSHRRCPRAATRLEQFQALCGRQRSARRSSTPVTRPCPGRARLRTPGLRRLESPQLPSRRSGTVRGGAHVQGWQWPGRPEADDHLRRLLCRISSAASVGQALRHGQRRHTRTSVTMCAAVDVAQRARMPVA